MDIPPSQQTPLAAPTHGTALNPTLGTHVNDTPVAGPLLVLQFPKHSSVLCWAVPCSEEDTPGSLE